eukprot:TRINITY_DN3203_c0_g2_i1.p1 TRINITY_DN3203_c0_g2~~TRINITY_DN3203_c0_g2_i1.p1  ORF type:complete len:484 (+),score=108.14 TRINITY_DN3203_c0_g2_i1:52-1503(+)
MSESNTASWKSEMERFGHCVLHCWIKEWTDPSAAYSVSVRDLYRAFCIFTVPNMQHSVSLQQFSALLLAVLANIPEMRQSANPAADGRLLLEFKPHAIEKIVAFRDRNKPKSGATSQANIESPSEERKQEQENEQKMKAFEETSPFVSKTESQTLEMQSDLVQDGHIDTSEIHDLFPEALPLQKRAEHLFHILQGDSFEEKPLPEVILASNCTIVHKVQALVQPGLISDEIIPLVRCLLLMGIHQCEAYAVMDYMGLLPRLIDIVADCDDEDALMSLLSLVCCLVEQPSAIAPEHHAKAELVLIPRLFSILRSTSTSEELGKAAVVTLLTVNKLFDYVDVTQSPFINSLLTLPQGDVEIFLEIFIAVFNRSTESFQRRRDLKFLKDVFSNPACIRLFYTNDLRVLTEIIVRELFDLTDDGTPQHVCNHYWEVLYTLLHMHPATWNHPQVRHVVESKSNEALDATNERAKIWASRIATEFAATL